jgi:hypothetical protein
MAQEVRELTARVREQAEPLVERAVGQVTTTTAPVVLTLADALDTSRVRGGAAWDALRGDRVGPPVAVRRWPWTLSAALLGALAGAAVAAVVLRVVGQDAPDAQEPEDLEAVVDRPVDGPPAA